ncbi:MAG: hypothetical protein LPL29_13390 [Alphaproteobacteria bacterium]|nr:hypothetical protein [Alphaproteobacteria bacterium]
MPRYDLAIGADANAYAYLTIEAADDAEALNMAKEFADLDKLFDAGGTFEMQGEYDFKNLRIAFLERTVGNYKAVAESEELEPYFFPSKNQVEEHLAVICQYVEDLRQHKPELRSGDETPDSIYQRVRALQEIMGWYK